MPARPKTITVDITLTRTDGPAQSFEDIAETLETELDAFELWVDEAGYSVDASIRSSATKSSIVKRVTWRTA